MTWSPFDLEGDVIQATVPPPADSPILVVDDEPAVLGAVSRYLREEGYPVTSAPSAREALEFMVDMDLALLITDLSMPEMDGIELARQALERDPELAVIIFTGVPDSRTAIESLRLGVADYVTKPLDLSQLEETVQRTLRRRAREIYRRRLEEWMRAEVDRRTGELQDVMVGALVSLVRAMEAKDPYLAGESERVARLCRSIGNTLELDERETGAVHTAGLLHDIGMVGTPESILHKQGKLTEEEYKIVKRHADVGAAILEPLTYLGPTVDYVRYHHERLNGSGYPEGLKGDEIPLGAQIVGVVDSFVALTENRPHRPACDQREALETLRATEGVWFSGSLLDALTRVAARQSAERRSS